MKKYLTVLLGLVLLITGLCVTGGSAEAKEDYEFSIFVHSSSISFWRPVKKGMEDAGEDLDVKVNFTGPSEMDHSEQVSMIENAISAGVDGIGTTITDPSAYDNVIEKGLDEDIPVLAVNADDPEGDNPRMSYIGQSPRDAGKNMGNEIVEYVDEGGKVALLIEDPGHTDGEERIAGAQEILDEHDISHEVIDTTTDISKATSSVMDYYQGNPDVDGWFGVTATATEGGAKAVEQLDVKDDVVAGGFDLTTTTLEAIQDGYADFTVDQHPYVQGYYTVHALYLYNEYGIEPANIDSGGGIVDESNVEEVMDLAEEGYR